MPPIAILEIPKNVAPSEINMSQAKKLCEEAGDSLHDMLNVPDPKDKESRVVRTNLDRTILRMAFTIGPDEYPDSKQKSFFPTKGRIESAGQSVLKIIKDSQLDVSRVVIEAWRDTTFVLREEDIPEPVSPVSEEVLGEIWSHLLNPRIRLVLSPQKREGVSFSKELGMFPEREYQEVALKLSRRMAEILGREEAITLEVEIADLTDTDIAVEFDCETKHGKLIPEEVRKYMAESVLHLLDSDGSTKEGSVEIWIRQGQPERLVIDR